MSIASLDGSISVMTNKKTRGGPQEGVQDIPKAGANKKRPRVGQGRGGVVQKEAWMGLVGRATTWSRGPWRLGVNQGWHRTDF
jgi:hypothetical protein